MQKIRLLVVDDSFIIRRVVTEVLEAQSDMEVVGTAINGLIALEKAGELKPDLVILDIEMPEMDGLTTLSELRRVQPNLPVIMFSSLTELGAEATLEALTRGASDFFAKPSGPGDLEASRELIRTELVPSIRALCQAKLDRSKNMQSRSAAAPVRAATVNRSSARPASLPNALTPQSRSPSSSPTLASSSTSRIDILAIGASTGGPNALSQLFSQLPSNLPVPIVIVQHMPPLFTQLLAERLSRVSKIPTFEASSTEQLSPGRAWLAPGGYHLVVEKNAGGVQTRIQQDPPENACRPAVDPLFRSVARIYGPNSLAVVLTGMGQDGMRGCQVLKAAGAQVLVQDEDSSVVWGMPGAVAKAGFADKILSLSDLAGEIEYRISVNRG